MRERVLGWGCGVRGVWGCEGGCERCEWGV